MSCTYWNSVSRCCPGQSRWFGHDVAGRQVFAGPGGRPVGDGKFQVPIYETVKASHFVVGGYYVGIIIFLPWRVARPRRRFTSCTRRRSTRVCRVSPAPAGAGRESIAPAPRRRKRRVEQRKLAESVADPRLCSSVRASSAGPDRGRMRMRPSVTWHD